MFGCYIWVYFFNLGEGSSFLSDRLVLFFKNIKVYIKLEIEVIKYIVKLLKKFFFFILEVFERILVGDFSF